MQRLLDGTFGLLTALTQLSVTLPSAPMDDGHAAVPLRLTTNKSTYTTGHFCIINANEHTCTRVTRHVVRLTSSWPWRCVGEAETPSSKGRPHGDAATTWCCKNTLTQHHTIFKGLFSLHVKLPSSSAVSAAAGIVGRTSVQRTAYQARTQSNIA